MFFFIQELEDDEIEMENLTPAQSRSLIQEKYSAANDKVHTAQIRVFLFPLYSKTAFWKWKKYLILKIFEAYLSFDKVFKFHLFI